MLNRQSWLQITILNTNNPVYGIKYSHRIQIIFKPLDETLKDTITLVQNEPGNNSNEGVFYIPQNWSLTTRCN